MPLPPPINSISLFRDLLFKVELDPDLAREVKGFADRPQSAVPEAEYRPYVESALVLAERCLVGLDAEVARLTEARFASADPNALRQKLLVEPRRQVDQTLNGLKQKVAAEKQEWTRRIAKQMSDVATSIEQQVETMAMTQVETKHEVVVMPDPQWVRAFEAWKSDVFARWASHLAPLLHAKTCQLVKPDLDALAEALGTPVDVELRVPAAMKLPLGREQPKQLQERFEVPTALETFFEMFKGSLSTVAMIAGMVVIPVIGSLMHTAATSIRALVMGGTVLPIVVFAVFAAKKHRQKLVAGSQEKARDKLRKGLAAEAKADLDRFRPDAERYSAQYCTTALATSLSVIEPLVAQVFERKERAVAQDLAKAQLGTDRVMDQLQTLRQVRSQLAGTLLVDLKRRLAELDAALATRV